LPVTSRLDSMVRRTAPVTRRADAGQEPCPRPGVAVQGYLTAKQ
jgi:hypothetical protein